MHTEPKYLWQAPAPSQVPSVPQVATGCTGQSEGLRGMAPDVRLVHVPSEPLAAQVWQPPVQALLQQTPSTQNPLWHCPLQAQAAPAACLAPLEPHASCEPSVPPSTWVAPPAPSCGETSCDPSVPPSGTGGAAWWPLLLQPASPANTKAAASAPRRMSKLTGRNNLK